MKNTIQKVLLVDDDPIVNHINTHLIKQAGWQVEVLATQSADEGLTALQTDREIGMILLDLNMPVKSGWDFLNDYQNLLQAHPEYKRQRVILLSSSADPRDEQRALAHPLVEKFIPKPLNGQKITSLL